MLSAGWDDGGCCFDWYVSLNSTLLDGAGGGRSSDQTKIAIYDIELHHMLMTVEDGEHGQRCTICAVVDRHVNVRDELR